MEKIKTDRQFFGEILCVPFIICSLLGVVFYHAWHLSEIDTFLMITMICGMISVVLFICSAVLWLLRNHIDGGGIRYICKHYLMVLKLRRQLLEAGIYTTKKFITVPLAVIPRITINFEPDFKSGRIYIENSIQFHDRLGRIDISPSLGRYVVEQAYLTENENLYYFDFYDSSLERKITFDNFETFRAYSDLLGQYELFIDAYTKLPLTHQLLVGQTGSGKTYALRSYILQMLLKPMKYHLYFADPKESSIALLGEQVSPDTTAYDFEEIVTLLETFVAEMHKRQHQMKNYLSNKIDGDYRDFGLPPHILIFDEFADFSLLLQTKEKKQRDHVNYLISEIVLKGRQGGYFLWIVMQQAGSNNIPTFIRDNLPWKVVLGNAEDQTYNTAFGAGVEIPQRKMEAGDGVYTYPAVANKPRLCSFPALEFDILEALEAGVM